MEEEFYRYKAEKEAFVSNLNGTSVSEILVVISVFPLSLWVQRLLYAAIAIYSGMLSENENWAFEYITLCFPLLLSFTLFSEGILLLSIYMSLFVLGVGCVFYLNAKKKFLNFKKYQKDFLQEQKSNGKKQLQHLSAFRSMITLCTMIAILAVDFNLFPRRFAKAETFGTGLMDIGVGCFVLSNSVVIYPKLRRLDKQRPSDSRERQNKFKLKSSIPLLLLGFGRFIGSKSIEYQEHASEYGVHWNFFFTLAAVNLAASIIDRCGRFHRPSHYGVLGLLLLATYQFALMELGLEDWILHAQRTDIISQNKEGLCSTLGFLGLFYIGVWLGSIYETNSTTNCDTYLLSLWCMSIFAWIAFFLLDQCKFGNLWMLANEMCMIDVLVDIEPVSRRLANITYCAWVLATSHQMVTALLSVLLFSGVDTPSKLVQSINRNQLAVFLLANLATGLVNVFVDTIHSNNLQAFLILNVYLSFLVIVSLYLDKHGLTLKFW